MNNMIEASIIIHRPVIEVFNFYRDFRNLPRFLGDVMAVEPTGQATSRWTIQGPLHIRIHWIVKVTEERENSRICYETTSPPPRKTRWEIYFAPAGTNDNTEVREVMKAPIGRIGFIALALIGKNPVKEVNANLLRLKQLMETGKVTATNYSVSGKF